MTLDCQELPPVINRVLDDQLRQFDYAFTVADCSKPDIPICFASKKFYDITGYTPEEVLGRNCRFLQGPQTERRKVMEIRDAMREERCCQVCLLNYRKDGSSFFNQFFLSPVRDDQGIVTHYVGIQTDMTQLYDQLDGPADLQEQQAAVALGSAAGCKMCDMVMQKQEVQQQVQQLATISQTQHQQQPQDMKQTLQQQPHEQSQQQQPAQQAATAGLGSIQQQQQQQQQGSQQQLQRSWSDDENVVQEEQRRAREVHDAVQKVCPQAQCSLPSCLSQSLIKIQQSFVLADPRLPDTPIVHASQNFLNLTGYSKEEVVGRNCRFLQGPATHPTDVQRLRDALSANPPQPITVTLLNYSKQGRPFWNALHIAPVRDADGRLEYFIGIQLDVTSCEEEAADTCSSVEAGFAASGLPAAPSRLHLSQKMAHYSTTGAVRVACRGLSGKTGGLRRSLDVPGHRLSSSPLPQSGLPRRGYSRSLSVGSNPSSEKKGTSSRMQVEAAEAAAASVQ